MVTANDSSATCDVLEFVQAWSLDEGSFSGAGDQDLTLYYRTAARLHMLTMVTDSADGIPLAQNRDLYGNPEIQFYRSDQTVTMTLSVASSQAIRMHVDSSADATVGSHTGVSIPLPHLATVGLNTTQYAVPTQLDADTIDYEFPVETEAIVWHIDRLIDDNFDTSTPSSAGFNTLQFDNLTLDTDGDGVFDHLDEDDDGDMIGDSAELTELSSCDIDGDGLMNSQDTDSDNDGVLDAIEAGNRPATEFEIVDAAETKDAIENGEQVANLVIRRIGGVGAVTLPVSILQNAPSGRAGISTTDYYVEKENGAIFEGDLFFTTKTVSQTLSIIPIADALVEVPETISTVLQTGSSYVLNDNSATTVRVIDDSPGIRSTGRLFVGTLRAAPGVDSSGTGLFTIRLSGDNAYAIVEKSFQNLTSPETASHIHISPAAGPIAFSIPRGQVSNVEWGLDAAHQFTTNQAMLDALLGGQLYVNIHSANYPSEELRGNIVPVNGSVAFVPPAAGDPVESLSGDELTRDIIRFLNQSTFGATPETVADMQARVAAKGGDRIAAFDEWLNEQILLQSPSMLAFYQANRQMRLQPDPVHAIDSTGDQLYGIGEAWFTQAAYGKAQLRERVGFALSEILVISTLDSTIRKYGWASTSYYDVLKEGAFGRYEDLLGDVSRHPTMGVYLSHLKNQAELYDENGNLLVSPDENYAREIMQLFSIGLLELHPDGSLRLNSEGLPIETYTQTDITELARAFTGWSFGKKTELRDENLNEPVVDNDDFDLPSGWHRHYDNNIYPNWSNPMINFEDNGRDVSDSRYVRYHDNGEKSVLGGTIPAGQTGAEDLENVLDLLNEHANTAPFISYRLIQRLVTSNPSAGYVHRVATVWEDTDGDLGAVTKAILLDSEARNVSLLDNSGIGKKREPLLQLVDAMRTLDLRTDFHMTYTLGTLQTYGLSASEADLYEPDADLLLMDLNRFGNPQTYESVNQAPLRAPSVFNWWQPSYAPAGAITEAGLVSPELGHASQNNVVSYYNAFYRLYYGNYYRGSAPVHGADRTRFAVENPDWLLNAYMGVMDSDNNGVMDELDAAFNDPTKVREASGAVVDVLDTYLCAQALKFGATGDPNTDPREIIITGIVEGLDNYDHKTAEHAVTARDRRIEDALYLITTAPPCAIQK
ncbi:MAG: DUF1800 family protein [Candidatus Promineifilaceae bacterium]